MFVRQQGELSVPLQLQRGIFSWWVKCCHMSAFGRMVNQVISPLWKWVKFYQLWFLKPSSVAQCSMPLPDPKHGIVTCSQAKEYESVCKFYCDQGYTLSMNGVTDVFKLYEQVKTHMWLSLAFFNFHLKPRYIVRYSVKRWFGSIPQKMFHRTR